MDVSSLVVESRIVKGQIPRVMGISSSVSLVLQETRDITGLQRLDELKGFVAMTTKRGANEMAVVPTGGRTAARGT